MRNIKRSILVLALASCVCTTASCSFNNRSANVNNVREKHTENLHLTQEEENILCDTYINEEQIRNGELYSYQIECLNQLRFSKDYLRNKYNRDFLVINFIPITKVNKIGEMYFTDKGSKTENVYHLNIEKNGSDYVAIDNYYQTLIQEKYDYAVKKLIKHYLGIESEVYTNFNSLLGDEINGGQSVEELFQMGSNLPRTTFIFLDKQDVDESRIEEDLKKVVYENNLYGSYHIYCGEYLLSGGQSAKVLRERLANDDLAGVSKIAFDNFDVK